MGSRHGNGDRDEVEDFGLRFRGLLGASDCDGNEHSPETCVGALIVRRYVADPQDVRVDLFPEPNRHRSARLDHLGDYVYSLTEFPRNPNLGAGGAAPSASAERGRLLFNDPIVHCSFCHASPPPSPEQFSDKHPAKDYDPNQTPRADLNNPFFVHDVGTANVFDQTNPFLIANDADGILGFTLFQNRQNQVPGNRAALTTYITSVLSDAWNTAPYLHDGSAPTLLAVVHSCLSRFGDCAVAGKGRNVDDLHGVTSMLSARQLNDLAAFEAAPHGPTVEGVAIHGTALTLKKVRAKFGKKAGKDVLTLVATAALASGQAFDPAAGEVAVTIGVPAADQTTMTIVGWTFAAGGLGGRKGRFHGKDPVHGLKQMALVVKNGKLTLKLAARTDLSALKADTEWTIGLEVGADVAAVTQPLKKNRKGNRITS